VVIGWTAGIKSINELVIPSSLLADEVIYRLFLHLVEERPDYAEHPRPFAPQLARSYDWSPDHKTLTFHLRDGLTWSDGVRSPPRTCAGPGRRRPTAGWPGTPPT